VQCCSRNIFSDAFSSPVLIESNDEAFITSLGNCSIITGFALRIGLLLILSYNLRLLISLHHPPKPERGLISLHTGLGPFTCGKHCFLMDLKIKWQFPPLPEFSAALGYLEAVRNSVERPHTLLLLGFRGFFGHAKQWLLYFYILRDKLMGSFILKAFKSQRPVLNSLFLTLCTPTCRTPSSLTQSC